jgi:hypothetical protein
MRTRSPVRVAVTCHWVPLWQNRSPGPAVSGSSRISTRGSPWPSKITTRGRSSRLGAAVDRVDCDCRSYSSRPVKLWPRLFRCNFRAYWLQTAEEAVERHQFPISGSRDPKRVTGHSSSREDGSRFQEAEDRRYRFPKRYSRAARADLRFPNPPSKVRFQCSLKPAIMPTW